MLPVHVDAIRLTLHVLAATVWVGGQITLGALVPTLRHAGADVPRMAAQQLGRVAWTAYAVLIVTGIWNISTEHDEIHGQYRTTLWVKIGFVVASGVTAWLHTRASTPRSRGILGGLSALTAIGAVFFGVLLAG